MAGQGARALACWRLGPLLAACSAASSACFGTPPARMRHADATPGCRAPSPQISKLQELKDIRKSYLDQIMAIKASTSGLDVRTEVLNPAPPPARRRRAPCACLHAAHAPACAPRAHSAWRRRLLRPTPQEELDAKVAAMEAEISHGELDLRAEKQMIRDISNLKKQRERVREGEGRKDQVRGGSRGATATCASCMGGTRRMQLRMAHAAACSHAPARAAARMLTLVRLAPAAISPPQLAQLEGELSKVKATIKELDTEVTALRGERSGAIGILQEIQGKLRVSGKGAWGDFGGWGCVQSPAAVHAGCLFIGTAPCTCRT